MDDVRGLMSDVTPLPFGRGWGWVRKNRRDLRLSGFVLITHALEGHVRLGSFVQILATLWINVMIVAIDCTAFVIKYFLFEKT